MSQGTLERVRAGRRPLERCAGDAPSFLANDWGKRAAVRLGGPPTPSAPTPSAPAGFEDLLSLDDVDRFLTTTALRSPFFPERIVWIRAWPLESGHRAEAEAIVATLQFAAPR